MGNGVLTSRGGRTVTATPTGSGEGTDKNSLDVYVTGSDVASTTTAGTPVGVIVSTTAVLLAASNVNRKSILITNNGTGKLYIGHTSGVTDSGATMGLILTGNGSYSDSGDGIYTGDIYGIYDTAATAENVSVSERT